MIITDLSQYLRRHRRASVADMAMGLGTSAEALAPMLEMLERKGRIRKLPAGSSCGSKSCCKCDPATVALYEWAGSEAAQHGFAIGQNIALSPKQIYIFSQNQLIDYAI